MNETAYPVITALEAELAAIYYQCAACMEIKERSDLRAYKSHERGATWTVCLQCLNRWNKHHKREAKREAK